MAGLPEFTLAQGNRWEVPRYKAVRMDVTAEKHTFLREIKNPVDVNLRGCLLVEAEVGIEPA